MIRRVGIIGCGRMASTIEDEQITRRKQAPYRGGIVLPRGRLFGLRGYTDFRELIEVEQPDILSITTRPKQRTEAVIYGAEHGVKGM